MNLNKKPNPLANNFSVDTTALSYSK